MNRTYYNEIDPKAAAWLRELMKAGAISDGVVDERDIRLVQPADLVGFTRCHFFAGIGVWDYALRQAGWPDDREVWTGSCPCQPFSAIGRKKGFADDRHLWPEWFRLIRERRPATVFGEQVASKDGLVWVDLVQTNVESTDYAFAAFDLCAASVGAPHIRQRLYFVADAGRERRWRERLRLQLGEPRQDCVEVGRGGEVGEERSQCGGESTRDYEKGIPAGLESSSGVVELGDTNSEGFSQRGNERRLSASSLGTSTGETSQRPSNPCGLADTNGGQSGNGELQRSRGHGQLTQNPLTSFWSAADWLYCCDGKFRPVEPGTFPLAHGAPGRVGRLRGYGNAIVGPLAEAFVKSFIDLHTS